MPPNSEDCYRIKASGIKCKECTFKIKNEKKGKELYELYKRLTTEKERKHYSFVNSEYWKNEIRPKILQHDNYTCLICKEKIVKRAHIHHILDFSADADLSPRNLVTLCNKCHTKLHPVFPDGMWSLGWPDLNKVKMELNTFYNKVREASETNRNRFKAPLEHIMLHICLICPLLNECDIGKGTSENMFSAMKEYDLASLSQNRYHIAELHDGMSHVTVEGVIVDLGEPREVETRYGKTSLVIAKLRDDTGDITLNLFGEQIGTVALGDTIRIENGYTLTYQGQLTLNVPKEKGRIIANPEYSIPFPSRKVGRKGKIIEGICKLCGKSFTYEYLGGPVKKYCEKCSYTKSSQKDVENSLNRII